MLMGVSAVQLFYRLRCTAGLYLMGIVDVLHCVADHIDSACVEPTHKQSWKYWFDKYANEFSTNNSAYFIIYYRPSGFPYSHSISICFSLFISPINNSEMFVPSAVSILFFNFRFLAIIYTKIYYKIATSITNKILITSLFTVIIDDPKLLPP